MSNGYVLWEGPSLIDGAPIVVIATGFKSVSTNRKTGAVIQTYILRSDVDPISASKSGADESICGTCPHRGDGHGGSRACYVNLGWGPRSVYAAYKKGTYPKAPEGVFAGKTVRWGAYGEPVAAPIEMWEKLLADASSFLGYTHRWEDTDPTWSRFCMASVETIEEMDAAQALGYRTFRVTPGPKENIKGREIVCPASAEVGKKATCEECKACMGTSAKAKVSVSIAAHGSGRKYVSGG